MTQKKALEILLSGRNAFLTGPPGSGKTYLINKFIEIAQKDGKHLAITATTGIAATHLSGQTINSWAGIGINRKTLINRQFIEERFNSTDVLIIDEISMMSSNLLDHLDRIARINRKSRFPFGGMQVILVGDFFQLPPISKVRKNNQYVYKSVVWTQLKLAICYLDEQHRQTGGDLLTRLLVSIRNSAYGKIEQKIVSSRMNLLHSLETPIHLFCHNFDVDGHNNRENIKLPGDSKTFNAYASGSKESQIILKSNVLAPNNLIVKIGTKVMFVVNNLKAGYINGSMGVVVDIKNNFLVVKVAGRGYLKVSRHVFKLETNIDPKAVFIQFPLKLAWGISVHKSQGMTLDKAVIDLSHAFSPNMGYVALSRVKSLDGLFLKGYNPMAFLINNEVKSLDIALKKQSDKLAKN